MGGRTFDCLEAVINRYRNEQIVEGHTLGHPVKRVRMSRITFFYHLESLFYCNTVKCLAYLWRWRRLAWNHDSSNCYWTWRVSCRKNICNSSRMQRASKDNFLFDFYCMTLKLFSNRGLNCWKMLTGWPKETEGSEDARIFTKKEGKTWKMETAILCFEARWHRLSFAILWPS